MSEYVKWEPVVGQVPPDGCEFIGRRNTHEIRWPVWADSGNRPINSNDPGLFSFRIPAPTKEKPVVIKYFTFEERPEAATEYKTLADVPEGVRCVCNMPASPEVVRYRCGDYAHNTLNAAQDTATGYNIIQILDPLPAPQLPATMAEAEECRVYKTQNHPVMFKTGGTAWYLSHASGGKLFPYDRGYGMDNIITAATNTYAVPCSQEVK